MEINACRALEGFVVPVLLEGRHWSISASIGIARYPQDATDLAQLFRHADQAM